jgi:cytochrome b561
MTEDLHSMGARAAVSDVTGEAYDRRTIVFHWLTAALVAFQWVGAHYIDAFPRGPLRVDARSTHIAVGAALIVIILARLAWRATGGRKLAPVSHPVVRYASQVTHGLLYALLAAALALGVANAWERGDNLFNLVKIASFAPSDTALKHAIETVHEQFANALLIVAGAHALAALAHEVIGRDRILRRMLPRRIAVTSSTKRP